MAEWAQGKFYQHLDITQQWKDSKDSAANPLQVIVAPNQHPGWISVEYPLTSSPSPLYPLIPLTQPQLDLQPEHFRAIHHALHYGQPLHGLQFQQHDGGSLCVLPLCSSCY
jgi:hypothetical protein